VTNDAELEIPLRELALTPLDVLLARANPALRSVLMRLAIEPPEQPTNARFNAFVKR
jgi:hypothetical protein